MRIAVCVKQVPETKSVKMDENTGTVKREGVEAVVNPLDLYAVEAALQLKERYGGEVVAISMGPPQAASALREVMAMGIDSGVLVSDRAFAGSDTWATGYILAATIETLGAFDMILCGERATDGDTGQVGPEMASYLKLPVISYVNRIEKIEDGHCLVGRQMEEGTELLSMRLPGVLTVVKEVSSPRLPTLRGKIRAKQAQVPLLTMKELALDAEKIGLKGSPTRVVKIFRPKLSRTCKMMPAADAAKLTEAIAAAKVFLSRKEVL